MFQYNLIFILFVILCIYIVVKIYKYFVEITIKKIKHYILLDLDNYYVTNIYFTATMILLYFMLFFIIFFFYRLSRFGMEIPIESFTKISGSTEMICNLLLFLLAIRYYIKTLTLIFHKYILQLHFYFLQYEIYDNILNFERDRYHWVSEIFSNTFCYFYDKTCTQEQFVNTFFISYKNKGKDVFKSRKYAHWTFVQKYKIIFYGYKVLSQMFSILSTWSSRFLYYVPYSILFLVFLYDIHNSLLKYTFYILFALFLLNFIRKARYFVQVKDPVYDDLIMKFFYKNSKPYADIRHLLYEKNLLEKDLYNFVVTYGKEISHYISVDFHVNYVVDPENTRNRTLLNNYAKRLNIIFITILLLIYCIYSKKYFIVFFNLTLELYLIILILNIILYLINRNTIYIETKNSIKKALVHARYIWLFYIIIILYILALCFILKNHLIIMPSEIIYIFGDSIKLLEVFSFEEKQFYVKRYIKYYALESRSVTLLLSEINDHIKNNTLAFIKQLIDDEVIVSTKKQNFEDSYINILWKKISIWFIKK